MKDYTLFEEIKYINTLLSRRSIEKNFLKLDRQLTRVNAFIIKYLVENNDKQIFQKDIEEKFGITKSTASSVLKLMEEKQLIERKSLPNDGRFKQLLPTQKAVDIHNSIKQTILEDENLFFNNFSNEELTSFKILLKKLKDNIKNIKEKEETDI
ncbi:MAG: MarR family transcriptional regulator [Clostridia bacterium]|nr:MarR family transcriptional regulator [Clostridia bacterium]